MYMYEKYKYTSFRAHEKGVASRERIIEFVSSYLKENGYSPTQTEIGNAVGLSTSSVNRYVWELVDKGILAIDCNVKSRRNIKLAN